MCAVSSAWGQKQLRVAAAADLEPVMPVLSQQYEKATGVKLVVSFGSSSTLATQILGGAPMDIFLGADFTYPEKVVAAGLADGASPTAYAKGSLVLWTRSFLFLPHLMRLRRRFRRACAVRARFRAACAVERSASRPLCPNERGPGL